MPENPTATAAPMFVSAQEAATILGLSRADVYQMLKTGELLGTRRNSRHLVLVASIHAYAYRQIA